MSALKNYLVSHWRGDLGLATSFWLNGVVGYLAMVALIVGLRDHVPVIVGLPVFGIFMIWVSVGVTHSALRMVRSPHTTITRKFKAYLALVIVVVVVIAAVSDIIVLLR